MTIVSASSFPLNALGSLPQVNGAMNSWGQSVVANLVSKTIVDFTTMEVLTPVTTIGVLQSYSARELMIRPENERQFQWWMFHVKAQESYVASSVVTVETTVSAAKARGNFLDPLDNPSIVLEATVAGSSGNFEVIVPPGQITNFFVPYWNSINPTKQIALISDGFMGLIKEQTVTLSGGVDAGSTTITTGSTSLIPGTRFNNDDVLIIKSKRYRIMMTNDYKDYGYFEYHMIEDYQEATT